MAIDNQFTTVTEKLQQLIKSHNRLKKETETLRTELLQCRQQQQQALLVIDELQQQVSILKSAAGNLEEGDKKEFEKRLNQYIKTVDKCITYLSQ